jgi:hypothetical protein
MKPLPDEAAGGSHFAPQQFGNFDLVKHHALDFTDVTVSKWRSRKTGLTMLHLDYDGTYALRNRPLPN